jgi:hypothetical protein
MISNPEKTSGNRKELTLEEIHKRLGNSPNFASKADYIDTQGGIPKVIEQSNGITLIIHNYHKDPIIVRSHKKVEDYGTISLDTKTGNHIFSVALLRAYHGDPCEKTSLTHGGGGYMRQIP